MATRHWTDDLIGLLDTRGDELSSSPGLSPFPDQPLCSSDEDAPLRHRLPAHARSGQPRRLWLTDYA